MGNVEQQVSPSVHGTGKKPQETGSETPNGKLYFSQSEAAKVWGRNKGTINRHIKEGKLQEFPQPTGFPKLMAAQLTQLYGPPRNVSGAVDQPTKGTDAKPSATGQETGEIKALEATVATQRELIEQLRDDLNRERENTARERENTERARQDADRWHTAFDEIKALPAPITTAATSPAQPPRGLFARLFGKAS